MPRAELHHLCRKSARHHNTHLLKKLAKRRSQLQTKIDAFVCQAPVNLCQEGSLSLPHHDHSHSNEDDYPDEEEDGDADYDEDGASDDEDYGDNNDNFHVMDADAHGSSLQSVENVGLPLPSYLGDHLHQDAMVAALARDELLIRESQASDALQQLRLSLGMKAAIFRKVVSNAKSQKKKTRAWKAVHVATAAVQRHARSYRLAQHALVQLHADPLIMTRSPLLEKSDLSVSRDVVEENRVGQRSEHVSWIWRVNLGKDQDKNTWILESECCVKFSLPCF